MKKVFSTIMAVAMATSFAAGAVAGASTAIAEEILG